MYRSYKIRPKINQNPAQKTSGPRQKQGGSGFSQGQPKKTVPYDYNIRSKTNEKRAGNPQSGQTGTGGPNPGRNNTAGPFGMNPFNMFGGNPFGMGGNPCNSGRPGGPSGGPNQNWNAGGMGNMNAPRQERENPGNRDFGGRGDARDTPGWQPPPGGYGPGDPGFGQNYGPEGGYGPGYGPNNYGPNNYGPMGGAPNYGGFGQNNYGPNNYGQNSYGPMGGSSPLGNMSAMDLLRMMGNMGGGNNPLFSMLSGMGNMGNMGGGGFNLPGMLSMLMNQNNRRR